jgi:hypothetical protein
MELYIISLIFQLRHTIYTLKNTKIHIKNTSTLAPTCFGLFLNPSSGGLVDCTLPSRGKC